MSAFHFRKFILEHDRSAMKIGTDGVLLAAWIYLPQVSQKQRKILDIGCGCGLISALLAQRLMCGENPPSNLQIKGIDIDSGSCEDARINANNLPWPVVSIECISIQDFAKQSQDTFECIVSNPPFFSKSLKNPSFTKAMARHNELLSFEDLCDAVSVLLSAEGRFSLILPFSEKESFLTAAQERGLFLQRISYFSGVEGRPFKRILMQLGRSETPVEISYLSMYQAKGGYTEDFLRYVAEYYLARFMRGDTAVQNKNPE